jgi:hypothetical protein
MNPVKHDYSPSIEMYQTQLMSCQMIADYFKVSRQTIFKYLRQHGVSTAKHKISINCEICQKEILKPRCYTRKTTHHFCSRKCYYTWINNPNYNQHRQGQRIAREVFEQSVGFSHDWVLHHVDGNNDNNDISNLWAFKTNSDHMRYHRGGESLALIGSLGLWQVVKKIHP